LLFDHKQVSLLFRRENPYKKQKINDKILKDPDLVDVVNITVVETYINHIVPDANVSDLQIEVYKNIVGQVLMNQKDLSKLKLTIASTGFDRRLDENVRMLRNSIKNNLDQLPPIDVLQGCSLSCDNDVFLEILIMSIKNSSLGHQHDFFKIKNAKKACLEKKIINLKKNFNANVGEILRTERELNKIVEDDLREDVLKMKNFEYLNDEKMYKTAECPK
jgi:hypothetical protein